MHSVNCSTASGMSVYLDNSGEPHMLFEVSSPSEIFLEEHEEYFGLHDTQLENKFEIAVSTDKESQKLRNHVDVC